MALIGQNGKDLICPLATGKPVYEGVDGPDFEKKYLLLHTFYSIG